MDRLELVVVADDTVAVAALPASGSVTIGRGEECDIRIESRSVSRRHAILHLGATLRIEDLGGVNGTFVRDARLVTGTLRTQPIRKLAKESNEIAIGERITLGTIPLVVRRATERRPVAGQSGAHAGRIVRDPAMRALYEQVARAARSSISVLVLGETGVGKEVIARAIHDQSPRANQPFLELNCAALTQSLMESELFGHEKGAFTGANQSRAGLLESANGGSVFLDEIGELPVPTQVKLLRVLEDRKVLRIGAHAPRKLDVRFIAATNRDLEVEIANGSFREDLYFRLNGLTFVVPPLRERTTELAPLAEWFLAESSRMLDRSAPFVLSREALQYLERYAWPGNVRELRNAMERATVLASGDVILPEDLPAHVTQVRQAIGARVHSRDAEGTTERQRIVEALEQCAGNQTRAAKLLGISTRTMVNRMAEYQLTRPRSRS